MTSKVVSQAILGASDGAFTGLGLILGLLTGLTYSGLWGVALTTTVAGTTSMALGELQADNSNGWRECVAMGLSWAVLCLVPVLTMLLIGSWALVGAGLIGLGAVMTRARDGHWSGLGAFKTYLLMAGVAVPTILTGVLV